MIDSEDRYRSTIRVPVPLGKKGNLAILLVLKKGCGKGGRKSAIPQSEPFSLSSWSSSRQAELKRGNWPMLSLVIAKGG